MPMMTCAVLCGVPSSCELKVMKFASERMVVMVGSLNAAFDPTVVLLRGWSRALPAAVNAGCIAGYRFQFQ